MEPPLEVNDVYRATALAISDGRLVRPGACENCRREGRIMAHHDDYQKPLDVRWLCTRCHSGWHRSNKATNRESPWTTPEAGKPAKPGLRCLVCGGPVSQRGTRAKRLYHPECKKVKNYIDAAVRAAHAIDVLDDGTKRTIRGLLFSAAHQLRTPPLRDACGRFVGAVDDPPD